MPKRNFFDTKHRHVGIRMTTEEYIKVKRASEEARRGLSDYIRIILLDHIDGKGKCN